MKEKNKTNRKWVIKFAAAFIVVLLFLTFFSNTIMNYSLPKVATVYLTDGSIENKVRASGVIASGSSTEVISQEVRTVNVVMVKDGDLVEKGDLLLTFTEEKSEELKAAEETLNNARASYDQYIILNEVPDSIVARVSGSSKGDYSIYKSQLQAATASINTAESAVKTYTDSAEALQKSIDSLQLEIDRITAQEEYDESVVNDKKNSLTSLQTQLDKANASLKSANDTLEAARESHTKALDAMNQEIELVSLYDSVQSAQEALDKLNEKGIVTRVTAPCSGTVGSITVAKGSQTSVDEAMLVITGSADGYMSTISVTNAQAQRIKPGDKADIDESWYYSDIEATVKAIRNDTDNPGRGKLVDIIISGSDIAEGVTLNFSIGDNASNYDMVVPNGAVREDKDGKFILTIRQKSSPLGNRYFAKRVNVTVAAEDDVNSAVIGDLEGGEYVITTSTKSIKAGDQVRLAEN